MPRLDELESGTPDAGDYVIFVDRSDVREGFPEGFPKKSEAVDLPTSGGSGDVTGPASATANAVARYDGTTGKIIKSSTVTIDDAGNVTTAGTVDGRDVSADGAKLDSIAAGANNYVLPSRLGPTYQHVSDWNDAVENGWYAANTVASNSPAPGFWTAGTVESYDISARVTQTVTEITLDNAANTRMWRRDMNGGTWTAWYRLRWSEAELDARYAAIGRTITATAPLRIGGGASADLSANRTLSILAATTGAAGSMSAGDKAKLDGVDSGTYTPTFTAVTNVSSLGTTFDHHYTRVGNTWTISGAKSVNPTSSGQVDFRMSLPAGVTFTNTSNARGPVSAAAAQFQGGGTFSDAASNEVQVRFFVSTSASLNVTYAFSYTA